MAITYNNLYMDIRQKLHRAGIDAATLEARELVAFAAGKTRQELLRDGGLYVSQEVEQRAAALAERHLAGEPLAYLIGEWSFCGMDLDINESVLIPRVRRCWPSRPLAMSKPCRNPGCWICAPAAAAWGWRWPNSAPAAMWCWAS